MSSNLPVVFSNEHFGSVRVIEKEGEPWFVARDVCAMLGFDDGHTNDAIKGLDEDEKATPLKIVGRNDFNGLRKDSLLVNEPGLYSLILRSNKPEAKAFKRWITHEVIPAIRRTGTYINQNIADPMFLRQMADVIEQKNKALAEANQQLALAAPKAEVYDAVVADRRLTLNVFCRRLRGVNLLKVKESLMNCGVLYRAVGGRVYRVYAKYRNTHFEEKFDNATGNCTILVLEEGQKLLTNLYNTGQLIMKQGYVHNGSGVAES
ncbi:hypothetical protein KUD97_07810 [Desulfovibrio desulfuricans]|uniref:Antirepressor n=1 Tax=Desulfovibrio phage ProddE TaxID=2866661 RepID=A0AAE9BM70_9CAUD|nr:BRO family protein [Desulfovibrio desulfuricans]UAJ16888.1 antirepressor [Desulfovibrio phage ProddE]UIA98897.1 hypothetical protein KUD97_07810 [Desulfovibrio desulfuricans]